MPGFAPERTKRGRYKCPYCDHKLWKQCGAAEKHIANFHTAEAEKSELQMDNERLERQKADLERRLKEAQKPPEKNTEYYDDVIYCTTDQRIRKVGMPKGQDISDTPCDICGNRTLHRVMNAQLHWF